MGNSQSLEQSQSLLQAKLQSVPVDRLGINPNIFSELEPFAGFAERGLDIMRQQKVDFVTMRPEDFVAFRTLANGAFKQAYLAELSPEFLSREKPTGRFVVKVARQGAPENGLATFTPQEREKIIRSDTLVGQVVALVFYAMKQTLHDAGVEVRIGCSRPVLIGPLAMPTGGELAILEAFTPGEFKKYVLQNGRVMGKGHGQEVAAALLHYSYVFSRGFCCVADIQGTDTEFTDCCLNTVPGNTNIADAGLEYLKSCSLLHECNQYCAALGINSEEGETTLANGPTARSFVTAYMGTEYASGSYRCLQSLPATEMSVRLKKQTPGMNILSNTFLRSKSEL